MAVTCALFGPLRETAGRKHVDVPGGQPATVRDVLEALVEEHPDLEAALFDPEGDLAAINVTVDGDHINQLDGLATRVRNDALVRIAPPVTGGGDHSDMEPIESVRSSPS